jgi:DNA-binding NtrC family response regulator
MLTAPELEMDLGKSVRPHTVVALDDDLGTLAALRRALRKEPYDLLTADDPSQVLEWLEDRDVSVVISDQRMPLIEGTELLGLVRLRSPQTQGIILTAYPECLRMDPELMTAISRVILKPWEDASLRGILRGLLRRVEESHPRHPEDAEGFEHDLGGEA